MEIFFKVSRLLENNIIVDDVDASMELFGESSTDTKDPRYNTVNFLFKESMDIRKAWFRHNPKCCQTMIRNALRKYGLL